MIKAIQSLVDKARTRNELVKKQRLYAQLLKDKITGPAKKEVEDEIAQLTLQLYGNGNTK